MSAPRTFEALAASEQRRTDHQLASIEAERTAALAHERTVAHNQSLLLQAAEHADEPFEPPPRLRAQVIQDILADDTLGAIADKAGTSIEQLALWMLRPDIAERIAAVKHAMAVKLEIRALNKSEALLGSISRIVDNFHELESHLGCISGSPSDVRATLRNREGVLKAASLMLRLVHTLAPQSAAGASQRSVPPVFLPRTPCTASRAAAAPTRAHTPLRNRTTLPIAGAASPTAPQPSSPLRSPPGALQHPSTPAPVPPLTRASPDQTRGPSPVSLNSG